MHIIFVLCTLLRYISKYNMPNTIYRRTCHCGNQYTAVCQCTAVLTTASIDKYAGRGPRCGGLQLLGQHAVLRGGAVQRDAVGRRPVARGVGAHVPVQPRSVPPPPSRSESIRVDWSRSESSWLCVQGPSRSESAPSSLEGTRAPAPRAVAPQQPRPVRLALPVQRRCPSAAGLRGVRHRRQTVSAWHFLGLVGKAWILWLP